jgi:hypothetical protein
VVSYPQVAGSSPRLVKIYLDLFFDAVPMRVSVQDCDFTIFRLRIHSFMGGRELKLVGTNLRAPKLNSLFHCLRK